MTEPVADAVPTDAASAGAILRHARERQGLELEALAAAIKVAPRKLEALEAGRFGDLPDIAFARALAKTVCRALHIDAEAVLASLPGLPTTDSGRLEQISGGLRTPFRDRAGNQGSRSPSLLGRPLLWTLVVLVLAVIVVYAVRTEMFRDTADAMRSAAGVVGAAPAAVADVASAVADAVQPAPAREPQPELPAPPGMVVEALTLPMPEPPALLVLRASAEAWVDVQDASGQTLVSRSLRAGETLSLSGRPPMRATIGNVAATSVTFRGEPVDLEKVNKGNVARLELR